MKRIDSAVLRRRMVDCQVRPADVTDYGIIEAMLRVPRERFLPGDLRRFAYADRDFRLPGGQVLLAPRTFAKMLQVAGIGADDMVLDVGTAHGYSAAVLSHLAEAVVALEEDPAVVEEATASLADFGVENCVVLQAPLVAGVPEHGPYDAILVQGGVEWLPDSYWQQLKDGGRLVAIHTGEAGGECRLQIRSGEACSRVSAFDATAPILAGFEAVRGFEF